MSASGAGALAVPAPPLRSAGGTVFMGFMPLLATGNSSNHVIIEVKIRPWYYWVKCFQVLQIGKRLFSQDLLKPVPSVFWHSSNLRLVPKQPCHTCTGLLLSSHEVPQRSTTGRFDRQEANGRVAETQRKDGRSSWRACAARDHGLFGQQGLIQ
jgi:hypothetical protein